MPLDEVLGQPFDALVDRADDRGGRSHIRGASGDHVATRWRSTEHHRGELMGIRPTNLRVEIHGCTVSEFKNGKVAHA